MLIRDAVVAWMRGRVTDTATRWEVLNEAACAVALAATLVNLAYTGHDLWRQWRSRRDGGTRLVARREVRLEAFRLARLLLWLAVFTAFLADSAHTLLLVALLPLAYFATEGWDSALNTVSRLVAWRYLATEVSREQAEVRAAAAAVDAAQRVEQVRLTLEATNAATGEKLEVIHHLVNSRLTEALAKIERLEARLEALTGEAPTGEPPPERPPREEGPLRG